MGNKFGILYAIFLFILYQGIFSLLGFGINTAVYGLFFVLILFYYLTDNLSFNKKGKYPPILINSLIYLIFLFFYKNISIFTGFIVFSICQTTLNGILRRIANKDYRKANVLNYRNMIKLFLDSISVLIAIVGAFIIKYDYYWETTIKIEYVLIYLGIFLILYLISELHERSWRYTNILDILDILKVNVGTAVIFLIVTSIERGRLFSLTLLLAMFGISMGLQTLGRYLFRMRRFYSHHKNGEKNKRVIIYGAGEAGVLLAREFLTNPTFPYQVVGFIDDDRNKIGTTIYGVKVLGNRGDLNFILANDKIDEILLAMPSVKSEDIRRILDKLKLYGNKDSVVKILPGMSELLADKPIASQLRSVRIEDLLGRDEIVINDGSIRGLIEDKTIFVTGGAGSIGSELSRQIAKFNPKKLVTIDVNENDIYFLELELKRKYKDLDLISEICNIREKEKLEFLFNKYRPNVVFHAAAHKHVPLMEHNPEEAIKNNIFGTKNVAECADKYGVERMVLISTDKAVNPTNLMGASKRACELVIEHMNKVAKNTKFMAVRFGNVLGSNGSVIPIFRKLIEEGKNLTLTHRDITRYFMTIPEAAQLVIEAGAIGNGGEIFILDMGKPVKIYDLAKTMIKLSNANVGIDIIGLRPGEKLFEELLYDVNSAIKTENKKIFITKIEDGNKDIDITDFYSKLEECTHNPNVDHIKEVMKELVISYKEVKYNI